MKPWTEVKARVETDELFIGDCEYLYFVNISHRKIRPMWQAFKKRRGIAQNDPASDRERWEFEIQIFNIYRRELDEWFTAERATMPLDNVTKLKELMSYADYMAGRRRKA